MTEPAVSGELEIDLSRFQVYVGEQSLDFTRREFEVAGLHIAAAGFEPVSAGGVDATSRIEVFGDLHPFGGLNGRLVGRAEALQLLGG